MNSFWAFATHNRAGEITYVCDPNNPFKYTITITTYTKILGDASAADRCELELRYGDGERDTIPRSNGGVETCPFPAKMGVQIAPDIKWNEYKTTHVFPGPGKYVISVEDPNRNENIANIVNSVHVTFFISSTLFISTFGGCNSSPVLSNPPIDNGCVDQIYEHNPGAIDPDGDSLVFSLVTCLGAGGLPISGYTFPNLAPLCIGGTLDIDPITGTVTWASPICQGEFNLCILIEEYRNGWLVGTVRRDMQITIGVCDNDRPEIQKQNKLCVIAGDTIDSIPIVVTDTGDWITLSATGEPLTLPANFAIFQTVNDTSTVTGYFYWETVCSQIRSSSYYVIFRAEDNDPQVSLVDYETLEILIIGPPPLNPTASPIQNSIQLNWDQIGRAHV